MPMARIARIVVPSIPHHCTQRGNRRQDSFFKDDAYREYISLMSASCRLHSVEIWAYYLICPSDCSSGKSRKPSQRDGWSTSPLHAIDQFQTKLTWAFMTGATCIISDEWEPSFDGGALHGVKSCSRGHYHEIHWHISGAVPRVTFWGKMMNLWK